MEHEFEQEFRMLGLKIAYYRKAKNLTQEQLAEKLGTSTSYIGSIESRTYKPISLTTLFRIAKVLDVPASKFFVGFRRLNMQKIRFWRAESR